MTARERGFLLLTSHLGDPQRKPLTVAQLRNLARRMRVAERSEQDRELSEEDLIACGYSRQASAHILQLLSQEEQLSYYLQKGKKAGCVPLTRVNGAYPAAIRRCLGDDSPGVLWVKGNAALLKEPCIALVGSRDLNDANSVFASRVGEAAAKQGYTLVSGNARGADRTAQESCLGSGGNVICVSAETLSEHDERENVLYLSEDSFDAPFSPARALSRNRVIHALARKTFVAQARLGGGGTWDGTVRNLRGNWSEVFCYNDGSAAARELSQLGAELIGTEQLADIWALRTKHTTLFDQ